MIFCILFIGFRSLPSPGDLNQVMPYSVMNTTASVSLWPWSWREWKCPGSLKIQRQSCSLHYLLEEILNFMTLNIEAPNYSWMEMWEIGIPAVREERHYCSRPCTATPHGSNLTQWTVCLLRTGLCSSSVIQPTPNTELRRNLFVRRDTQNRVFLQAQEVCEGRCSFVRSAATHRSLLTPAPSFPGCWRESLGSHHSEQYYA